MKKTKILLTEFVTHNVKRFILEKPLGYSFVPGQATDLAINQKGWRDKKHPFTFTSLNEDLVLEFIIKSYPQAEFPEHDGMTEKLHNLVPGDELLIDEPFGTINYRGPGVFIAGGAGITPFIAIFRELKKEGNLSGNKLIFSNKTKEDIILEPELRNLFGDNLVLTLTQEKVDGYENGRVSQDMLKKYLQDFSQNFYLCGPKVMVQELQKTLIDLGASITSLIFEK
jgi:predicted ferric reductase